MNSPIELSGARVTVMGLGRFGGGAGVTRWLVAQGADVLLTDLAPESDLDGPLESLRDLIDDGSVTLRLGGHNVSDFTDRDLVVANPAVPRPWDNRFLRAAAAASVPMTTEIRLLIERLPNWYRTIGVTGTVGKSTTSAMIAHLIREMGGIAWLGGNIGGSLLNSLRDIAPTDRVVLELSSAQLYWLGRGVGDPDAKAWSPAFAVITNIAPNHADWHGDFEHYKASKQQIIRASPPDGWQDSAVVLGESVSAEFHTSGAWTRHVVDPENNDFLATVRERLLEQGGLSTPGEHNITNALTAVLAVSELPMRDPIGGDATDITPEIDAGEAPAGRSPTSIAEGIFGMAQRAGEELAQAYAQAILTFRGLPHRLEFVGEFDGVRVFNDSKCTTPEGAVMALRAVSGSLGVDLSRVHLICGGYDKGADLSPMFDLARRCGSVSAIGTTSLKITEGVPGSKAFDVFERAIDRAKSESGAGDIILLSPACASWDQFTNYEERGDRFRAAFRPV